MKGIHFLTTLKKRIRLRTYIAFGMLLVLTPIILLSIFHPANENAAWFDDTFTYRTPLTFTHNADVSDTKVKFDIDTATLITAGKMQSDCGDSRFTDANGKVLQYYIDTAGGACNGASTDYYVLMPTIINGTNVIYHYYGNPSVANGTEAAQFAQATTTPSGGAASTGTEETTQGPVGFWKFDEGSNDSCTGGSNDTCDSSSSANDGALSGALWKTPDMCISGTCLYFDGTDDVVTVTNANPIDMDKVLSTGFTYEAWIRPNGAGEGTGGQIFFKGTNTWLRVDTLSSGKLDIEASVDLATTDATLNVSAPVTNGQWAHVALSYTDDADDELTIWVNGQAVGSSTNGVGSLATDSNNLLIGGTTTNNFKGFMDDFKIYPFEKTATTIKVDAIKGGAGGGSSAVFGAQDTSYLNNGLSGYWKLDETSGNAADSSGNTLTLTNNGTTTFLGGKFGTGSEHVPASSQHFSTATTISGVKTVSFWTNPDSTTNYYVSLTSGAYVTSSSGTLSATGFTSPTIYVNGVQTSTVVADVWQFVTVTTETAIDANQFYIGRQGSNYYDGTMDEVRTYNRALTAGEVKGLYQWTPGPTGYWKMDENSGTAVHDSSGNGYNSETLLGNTTWARGQYGSSIRLDGSGDGASFVDNDGLDVTTEDFTIGLWFRRTGNAEFTDKFGLFQKSNQGNGAVPGYALMAGEGSGCNQGNGDFVCMRLNDGADEYYILTTSTIPVDFTWHYIAAVIDRDSVANTKIYFDGVAQADTRSGTLTSVGSLSNANKLCIGLGEAECTGTQTTANGDIDDARLYKYARTPSQLIEDMNGGHPLGGSPIGTQAINWNFDEGSGTTANNAVSGGTAGTLTNMATAPSTSTSGWTQSGKYNKALVFDGSNDQVTIATANDSSVDFNGSEAFSICSWIYPTTLPGTADEDLIAGKWDATTPTRGYRLYVDKAASGETDAHIVASVYDESTDQTISAASANESIAISNWYHVCMTFNGGSAGAASDLKLYINGANVASNSANASFLGLEDVTADFTVGDYDATDAASADTAFTGRIDAVQVYAGELTSEQVLTVMNSNSSINISTGTAEDTQDVSGGAGTAPVAYYPFNENTGTSSTSDISGNGFTGTLTSMENTDWVPGKFGSALDFDGTAEYVTVSDSTTLQPGNGSWSVSLWAKPADSNQTSPLITKRQNSASFEQWSLWICGDTSCSTSGQQLSFLYMAAVGGDDRRALSSADVADGKWHHYAAVADKSTDTIYLYVDGVRIASSLTNAGAWPTIDNTDPMRIGNSNGSNYFAGSIDEVKVYNYARSASQVAYDYNRGGPLAWFKLDECSGTTAYNSAQNGSGEPIGSNGTITIGGSGSNTSVGNCSSGTTSQAWNNGTTGKFNASLDFDGTDDYVDLGDMSFTEGASQISWSLWVKPATLSTIRCVICKTNGSSTTQEAWSIATFTPDPSDLFLYFPINTTDAATYGVVDDFFTTGVWTHIVVVFDGTQSTNSTRLKLYKNGLPTTITTFIGTIGTTLNTTTTSARIGASSDGSNYFDGQVDAVRVYNYVLSDAQVKKLYNENAAVRFGPTEGQP